MKVNTSKTRVPKRKKIEDVNSINYLGITITRNGSWKEHIREAIIKGKRKTAELKKLMYKNEEYPIQLTF